MLWVPPDVLSIHVVDMHAVFALLGVPPDVLSNASSLRVKVKVDLFMNMYQ